MRRFLPGVLLCVLGVVMLSIAHRPTQQPVDERTVHALEIDPPRVIIPPDELTPHSVVRSVAESVDWGVAAVKAPEAWKTTKGKGAKVAVLDTGVDRNHPDLRPRIESPDDLKDFSRSRYGPGDVQGHGTHVAGSVLGSGPLPGIAPEASLVVAKVLGDDGSGSVVDIAAGIRYAVARGSDVINMSLGGPQPDSFMPAAIKEAVEAGVIVVAAAGNEGPRENTSGYPARYAGCISVAAVDKNLAVARFSSRGKDVYIAAPGVNIRSTYPGGQYATMSGTSMATPHVAGLAALWVAAHPEVPKKDRPKAFEEALRKAASDLPPTGRDTATGFGFPSAVELVKGGGSKPDDPVDPPPGKAGHFKLSLGDLTPEARERFKKVFGAYATLDLEITNITK